MNTSEHYIRPHGRHLSTIGEDLIQDQHAALVELVKNSYDADSARVDVYFVNRKSEIEIRIEDSGHGMSKEILVEKWLVPSTNDKIKRKKSPNGRIMQGRKGIGRYSVAILGNLLELTTVDVNKIKSSVSIDWRHFNNAKFLDEVPVLIKTQSTSETSGTKLIIRGGTEYLQLWNKSQFDKLINQLKKLKSPNENEDFRIFVHLEDFNYTDNKNDLIEITSYKIFEYFDYKISGKISSDGSFELEFCNQRAKNIESEKISSKLDIDVICGEILLDIRVFDREPTAIAQLIDRGLTKENGEPLGKLEARKLLDTYNGISVYRNGFRIRPLGEPGYDWLNLDPRRVQMPSFRISSNQVIGHIDIQSEEFSNLDEKSARDGLKENRYYSNLIEIVQRVIKELEVRRFGFRRMLGLGKTNGKVDNQLENLFRLDEFKIKTEKELLKLGLEKSKIQGILQLIDSEQSEKSKIADDLRKAIAIYQGQATLGKIINVVLHEGRRPLSFFKSQIPNIEYWGKEILTDYSQDKYDFLVTRLNSITENSQLLVKLFEKIDPLASGTRAAKKNFNLANSIAKSFDVFETDLIEQGIGTLIDCNDKIVINGWEQDFLVIFTNLLDNSIYWLKKKKGIKGIEVMVEQTEDSLVINFYDNGPGIPSDFIENKLIFEPEFSLKDDGSGSGLGLAIAGEAAARNGYSIAALEFENGAHFQVINSKKEFSNG